MYNWTSYKLKSVIIITIITCQFLRLYQLTMRYLYHECVRRNKDLLHG